MKKQIPKQRGLRLIGSGCVVLVTSAYKDKNNIITLAWQTPLSHTPALVGISVAKSHLSCELIRKSGEFVINIPDVSLLEKVMLCGKVSGRKEDKFKLTGFTPEKGYSLVKTPLIGECIGNIECSLRDVKDIGDHMFFIGEILHAQVRDELFDDKWNIDKTKLLYHLGGSFFTSSGEKIEA
ncbi:MAG: flavin reductase family protein [bacterium]